MPRSVLGLLACSPPTLLHMPVYVSAQFQCTKFICSHFLQGTSCSRLTAFGSYWLLISYVMEKHLRSKSIEIKVQLCVDSYSVYSFVHLLFRLQASQSKEKSLPHV